LFEGKHVVVEELLESLVGIVDAKLLERVDLEDFESRNIEDTDELLSLLLRQLSVNLVDDPEEKSVVESLAERFSRVDGLLGVKVGLNVLVSGLDSGLAETELELSGVDSEDFAGLVDGFLVVDDRGFSSEGIDLDVSEM